MKNKKLLMTVGAVAVVGILLAGIAMLGKDKPNNTADTQQVENSTENTSTEISTEQNKKVELTWIQLYDLDNYQDTLRTPMEHAANQGYYVNPAMKEGVFYHDVLSGASIVKNNTLQAVFSSTYTPSASLSREETIDAFADAAFNTYADLEEGDTMTNYYMALNGYFNILPDAEPAYANPDKVLTRAEFMSAIFRSETKVDENLKVNSDFADAVGDSEYNLYAQALEKDGYLNLSDKSLNEKTYNGSISRAEAIYMLMNHYYSYELNRLDTTDAQLEDVKDGGDIAAAQGYADKQYGTSYTLNHILNNPDEGVPTDVYKALVLAEQKSLIDSETRFDEGITKAEAIELIVRIHEASDMLTDDAEIQEGTDEEVAPPAVEEETPDIKDESADQGSTDAKPETPEIKDEVTDKEEAPPVVEDDTPSNNDEDIPYWEKEITYVDLTEDADGDGIISTLEDRSDGRSGYTIHYNDDGSNTTYMVDYETGQIIQPGDTFTNKEGAVETWMGTTHEDSEMAWKRLADEMPDY